MTLEIVKGYLFYKYRGRSLILCPKSYITRFLVSIHNSEILIHVIFFFFIFYQHVILKYQVKIIKSLCASNAFNVAFLKNLYTMYFLSWRFIFHRYRYGVSRFFSSIRFIHFIVCASTKRRCIKPRRFQARRVELNCARSTASGSDKGTFRLMNQIF